MVHTSSIALFATAAIFATSPALGAALPRSDLAVGEGSIYSRFFGLSQYDGRALSKSQEEKKLIDELEQLENGSPKKKNNAKGPVKHNNKAKSSAKHSSSSVHKTATSSKPARSSSARASGTKSSTSALSTGTSKSHSSTKASTTGTATETSSSKASASTTKSSSVTKSTTSSKASGISTSTSTSNSASRTSSASSVKPTSTSRVHEHERRPTGNQKFDAQRNKANLEKHLIDELDRLEGRDDAEYELALREYENEMMNIALRAYYEDELE